MKLKFYIFNLLLLHLCLWQISAKSTYYFSGYLTDMPSLSYKSEPDQYFIDNLIHNRLNFTWLPSDIFSASISVRNRLMHGQSYQAIPNTLYPSLLTNDKGYANLTHLWASGNNYLLVSNIDRLWLEYKLDKIQIRVGRQRINWGQSLVWNPNDVFNAYNYFDFDYPEKPGSDAIRVQYYTGNTALLEGVISFRHNNSITFASHYHFNLKGYDIQFIAGVIDEIDWVLGSGWSGNLASWGFYGEVTALLSDKSLKSHETIVSVGANKNFKNSLFLQTELLYSSNLRNINRNFSDLIYQNSSFKNLSISEFSGFFSLSKPVTSLLSGGLTFITFFRNETMYLSPSVTYSLTDNIYVSGIVQIFVAQLENNTFIDRSKKLDTASFIRLKWSF